MNASPKTCTQCGIEKPITEFHRRGHTHQNICKVCRLETAKLPHTPRAPRKDNSANYAMIGERIVSLEPRLRLIARSYSSDPHQAEDIFQFICEKLLQQVSSEDSDSRILTTAKRRAGDFLHTEKTYSFMVGDEGEIAGGSSDEDDLDTFEMYIGEKQSPEDIVAEREQLNAIFNVVSTLTVENQEIVAMLTDGYTQADIARELNVTRQAVNSRVQLIAKELGYLGLTPS